MRVSEFSIPFACDLPLATNHNIILFYCFYMNLSLSFIVPDGWQGRSQAGRAARWSRLSSPSNNPGLLAGGRGWCGAGLLGLGLARYRGCHSRAGSQRSRPQLDQCRKFAITFQLPLKTLNLNHLAYVLLHNLKQI